MNYGKLKVFCAPSGFVIIPYLSPERTFRKLLEQDIFI